MASSLTLKFYIVKRTKISNANCLDERTIPVDTILYLSLYYLVNDLVHLSYRTHQFFGVVAGDCWYFRLSNLNYLFLSIFMFSVIYFSAFYFSVLKKFKNTNKKKIIIPKIWFQLTLSYFELCLACFMCNTKTSILQFDPDIDKTECALWRAAWLARVRT